MSTTFVFQADGVEARLGGRVDFDNAVALEQQGLQWLDRLAGVECRLELSGLDYGNSALLAVLLSWQRTGQQQGKRLTVQSMPANLQALADVCGLTDHLLT